MNPNILVELLKIGGIAALSIGVLFLLYKQLMNMGIFPTLTKRQAFSLLLVVICLTFAVVLLAFYSTGSLGQNSGSGIQNTNIENTINSGDASTSIIVVGE